MNEFLKLNITLIISVIILETCDSSSGSQNGKKPATPKIRIGQIPKALKSAIPRHILKPEKNTDLMKEKLKIDAMREALSNDKCLLNLLSIDEKDILEDSYKLMTGQVKLLSDLKPTAVKHAIRCQPIVRFMGRKYSGSETSTKEWFVRITKEIFHPSNGLFRFTSTENDFRVSINGMCTDVPKLKFAGQIMAMALLRNYQVNALFVTPFLKSVLGQHLDIEHLEDIQDADPALYKELNELLTNEIDPSDKKNYRFVVPVGNTGQVHNLLPGGDKRRVTEENKEQYVWLRINWKFHVRIKDALAAFNEGFREVIPLKYIKFMTPRQFENHICGLPELSVKEWMANTKYSKDFKDKNHPTIVNFWKIVNEFNDSGKRKLLSFVTGYKRVPVGGFPQLNFSIHKSSADIPYASASENQLFLPAINDSFMLKLKIYTAIKFPMQNVDEQCSSRLKNKTLKHSQTDIGQSSRSKTDNAESDELVKGMLNRQLLLAKSKSAKIRNENSVKHQKENSGDESNRSLTLNLDISRLPKKTRERKKLRPPSYDSDSFGNPLADLDKSINCSDGCP